MAVMNPWRVRVLFNARDSYMESSLISKHPFNPRQFEYHPRDPNLLVFGTFSGQVVVWNHTQNKAYYISKAHQLNPTQQVLGLSWLRCEQNRDKFVVGTQKGTISVCSMNTGAHGPPFEKFPNLTSVHVNEYDTRVLVSGQSNSVRLYAIETGQLDREFKEIHSKEINLSRFANHSPYLFATCSFDNTVKLWDTRNRNTQPIYTCTSQGENLTVCFSPDDQRLLVSAVDDEFNQYCLLTGKLDWGLKAQRTGDKASYSRSYYTASGNMILSGSTEHSVVRMYCSHTGRLLHGSIQYSGRKHSALHTLSLRANPHDEFKFCALVSYADASHFNELIENTMVGTEQDSDNEYIHTFSPSWEFKQHTMSKLMDDRSSADISLLVDRNAIYAHSVVLSCRSTRFSQLLSSIQGNIPYNSPIKLNQVTTHSFPLVLCGRQLEIYCTISSLRLFLSYIYSDGFEIQSFLPSLAQELVHLARYFDLMHLIQLLEMKCSQFLSVQNVIEISNFAFQNQLHQLLSSCLRFLIMHRSVLASIGSLHQSIRYLLSEEYKSCTYTQALPECYGHICITDANGCLMLLGGIWHSPLHLNYISPKHILVLNLQTHNCSKIDTTGNSPSSLVYGTACAMDPYHPRYYVVCGGGHSQQPNESLMLFDCFDLQWITLQPPRSPSPSLCRIGHSISLLKSQDLGTSEMVLFGGCDVRTKEYYNDIHILHINSKMEPDWSRPSILGPLPLARMAHTATSIQSLSTDGIATYVVVFGGIGPGYILSTLHLLHVNQNQARWEVPTVDGTPPNARYGHSAEWVRQAFPSTVNSVVYFGGTSGSTNYQDLHVLDIEFNNNHGSFQATWSTLQTIGLCPTPRYRHSAAIVGSTHLVIFGGKRNDKDGALCDVAMLEIATNVWSTETFTTIDPGLDHSVIVQQSTWYKDIVNLLDIPEKSDIIFTFDDGEQPLHAHSFFLSRSFHMQRMLKTNMTEGLQGIVSLKKRKSVVRAFVEFVYTDRLRVLPNDLMELLDLVHSFNMKIFSALLEGIAINLLDEENVESFLLFGDIHDLYRLKMGCITFLLQNWKILNKKLFQNKKLKNKLIEWNSITGHAYMYDSIQYTTPNQSSSSSL